MNARGKRDGETEITGISMEYEDLTSGAENLPEEPVEYPQEEEIAEVFDDLYDTETEASRRPEQRHRKPFIIAAGVAAAGAALAIVFTTASIPGGVKVASAAALAGSTQADLAAADEEKAAAAKEADAAAAAETEEAEETETVTSADVTSTGTTSAPAPTAEQIAALLENMTPEQAAALAAAAAAQNPTVSYLPVDIPDAATQAANAINVLSSLSDTESIQYIGTDYQISAGALTSLESALQVYFRGNDNIGFVLLDLKSGEAVTYRAGFRTYTASEIKGPYIFSLLMSGASATNDMYLAGHNSDNGAYSRLRNKYGDQVFVDWLAGLPVDESRGGYNYTHLTPTEYASMWVKIYGWLYGGQCTPAQAQWVNETFTQSNNSQISNVLGASYQTYSKAGWISQADTRSHRSDYRVYTNGGIVLAGDHPYIVAILSYNEPGVGGARARTLLAALDAVHNEMVAWDTAKLQQAAANPGTDASIRMVPQAQPTEFPSGRDEVSRQLANNLDF